MVMCCVCGREYEPDPERLKAWGESGEPFDPTDWECPECREPVELEACQGCRWLVGDTCNGCCEDGFPLRAEEF